MLYFSSCDAFYFCYISVRYVEPTSTYVSLIECDFPVGAYFAYVYHLMLMISGKKVNKAENPNWVFLFIGLFWFHIWVVGARAQETHTGGGSEGNAGHIWGTSGFIQAPEQWSRAGVRCYGCSSEAPPPHLHLFVSLFLYRYRNMGNLLKVLTCTDLEQEPNFFLDFESEFL